MKRFGIQVAILVLAGCGGRIPPLPDSSGLTPFASGELWGYRRPDGSVAIPPRFQRAAAFSEGLAAVREKKSWWCSYIDATGHARLEGQFERCHPFRDGAALVERFDRELTFFDVAGSPLFSLPPGSVASDFGDGVAPVQRSGEQGFQYVDRAGRVAIGQRFAQARPFSQGRAAATRNGRWGYIDRRGEFVIPPLYVEAGMFREGRAAVQVEGSRWWGYVSADGRWAVEPRPDLTLAAMTMPGGSP